MNCVERNRHPSRQVPACDRERRPEAVPCPRGVHHPAAGDRQRLLRHQPPALRQQEGPRGAARDEHVAGPAALELRHGGNRLDIVGGSAAREALLWKGNGVTPPPMEARVR